MKCRLLVNINSGCDAGNDHSGPYNTTKACTKKKHSEFLHPTDPSLVKQNKSICLHALAVLLFGDWS